MAKREWKIETVSFKGGELGRLDEVRIGLATGRMTFEEAQRLGAVFHEAVSIEVKLPLEPRPRRRKAR